MSSFKKPTHEQIDKAIALMASPQHCRMFFGKLENPEWVAPLREKGCFAHPPEPIQEGDNIVFPAWPASEYLVRMAPLAPQDVFAAIEPLDTCNARVISDIAESACGLPGPLAAQLAQKIVQAVRREIWVNLYSSQATDLIVALATSVQVDAAFTLAETLFDVRATKGLTHAPAPRIDAYLYKKSLPKVVAALGKVDPQRTMTYVCGLLRKATSFHQRPEAREEFDDMSAIWRTTIEDHDQSRDHDVTDAIVDTVRDFCECVVREGPVPLQQVVEFLDVHNKLILRRIGLHLIRLFADKAPHLATQRILNREYFDGYQFRHEYAILLRDRFRMLTPTQQEELLGWIDAGPERGATRETLKANLGDKFTEDLVEKRVKVWQRDRLSWFCESLPPEWRARYDDLVATMGTPGHADRSFWMDSSWEGGKSPKNAAELGSMSTDALVAYLRLWRPDPDKPFGPTMSDLMGELGKAIENDPERFAVAAVAFADLHPTYVSGILNRFMVAIQNEKKVTCEALVDLCLLVVRKPVELAQEHRVGGDSLDSDPSWEYAKNAVANLVQQMCDHDAPFALREKLWACIASLHDSPDKSYIVGEPTEDMRTLVWLDRACNNPRAKIIHAIIRYAVWVKQGIINADGLKESDVNMGAIPEARALLEMHLSPDHRGSPAVHSEYGTHFTPLCWVDEVWAISHADDVFSLDGPRAAYGWAAWNSFLVANRAYNRVFRGIRSVYSRAIDTLTPDLTSQHSGFAPLGSLAEHLMLLCGRGVVSVTDEDDLLKRFFRQVAPSIRGHAIRFVGESLVDAEDLPPNVVSRFVSLWEWYWSEFGTGHPEAMPEQFVDFGWWLVCDKFEINWCLDQLAAVTQQAPLIEPEHKILEKLVGLIGSRPATVIDLADRMVRGDKKGWRLYDWREQLHVLLKAALASGNVDAEARARGLIDHVGRRGCLEFGELLKTKGSGATED